MITNQIALYFWDNEANVAKTLPINYKTGTFSSRDLEKLGFGIIPTRQSGVGLNGKTLSNMARFPWDDRRYPYSAGAGLSAIVAISP